MLRDTYRILHQLGAGGMGRIYAAAHARLPGLFAVKALHKEFANNEHAVLRFRAEAEIMAGLRHPHIVQVFDFDVHEDGTPYLVMEFIEGRNLGECMRGGEYLPPARVNRLVQQIASALDAAHRRGVVHRDLKPENIMLISELGQDDFVKVVDFGISKAAGLGRITSETTILGTPQYMAPEQAQGRHEEVDHRTDQFSLAAMTYTLLSGVEPFRGTSAVTVLYQVVHEETEPLTLRVDWPCARVDEVLRKAMAKSPADRYSSILEFATALDQAMAEDLRISGGKTARIELPAPESFVRREGTTNPERPRPPTLRTQRSVPVENTLVVRRRRRYLRSAGSRLAAVGFVAAALLGLAELDHKPFEVLRAALLAPAQPPAAVLPAPVVTPTPAPEPFIQP